MTKDWLYYLKIKILNFGCIKQFLNTLIRLLLAMSNNNSDILLISVSQSYEAFAAYQ